MGKFILFILVFVLSCAFSQISFAKTKAEFQPEELICGKLQQGSYKSADYWRSKCLAAIDGNTFDPAAAEACDTMKAESVGGMLPPAKSPWVPLCFDAIKNKIYPLGVVKSCVSNGKLDNKTVIRCLSNSSTPSAAVDLPAPPGPSRVN